MAVCLYHLPITLKPTQTLRGAERGSVLASASLTADWLCCRAKLSSSHPAGSDPPLRIQLNANLNTDSRLWSDAQTGVSHSGKGSLHPPASTNCLSSHITDVCKYFFPPPPRFHKSFFSCSLTSVSPGI